MSKKVTLEQRVRSYLNTRKTAATVDQVVRGIKVDNPVSSVSRTLRSLVENGEVITTGIRGKKGSATYILKR